MKGINIMKKMRNVLWITCAVVLFVQIFMVNNASANIVDTNAIVLETTPNNLAMDDMSRGGGERGERYCMISSEVLELFLYVRTLENYVNLWLQYMCSPFLVTFADETISSPDLTLGGSYSSIEDRRLMGKGHDTSGSAFMRVGLSESLTLGVGYAHVRYDINTRFFKNYEENVQMINATIKYDIDEHLAVYTFANFTTVDVEDDGAFMDTTFDRWGMGMAVSYNWQFNEHWTAGYLAVLASSNKSSVARIFDDEDSYVSNSLNVAYTFNNGIRLKTYGTIFTALDREDDREDGCYGQLGANMEVRVSSNLSLSLGYETLVSNEDINTNTINASMTFNF